MGGLLPGRVTVQKRLAGLGPQQLDLGDFALRGHTFHHATCETRLKPAAYTTRPGVRPAIGARAGETVYGQGAVRASCFHAGFASGPEATARLFDPRPIEGLHG